MCANHQSNFDPMLMGSATPRRINYLGKKSLFDKQPLSWILHMLDTVPIDRDGAGIAGMKEVLRRLKRGENLLIFPEGQRSTDGEMRPFMHGFVTLVRRSKLPIVPVGIDGPFKVWPRGKRLPNFGPMHIVIGDLISFSTIDSLSDEEVVDLVHQEVKKCFLEARRLCERESSTGQFFN